MRTPHCWYCIAREKISGPTMPPLKSYNKRFSLEVLRVSECEYEWRWVGKCQQMQSILRVCKNDCLVRACKNNEGLKELNGSTWEKRRRRSSGSQAQPRTTIKETVMWGQKVTAKAPFSKLLDDTENHEHVGHWPTPTFEVCSLTIQYIDSHAKKDRARGLLRSWGTLGRRAP